MTSLRKAIGMAAFALLLGTCARRAPGEVRVAAASSLADVMRPLASAYEHEHPGARIVLSFAGSSTLARQIEHGAPVDLFISADDAQMDRAGGAVGLTERHAWLENRLVLVTTRDALVGSKDLDALLAAARGPIALGSEALPAGRYARRWLRRRERLARVLRRAVPMESVRQIAASVAQGHADLGFVYATDRAVSPKLKIAYTPDPAEVGPIVYPLGLLATARTPEAARRFARWLLEGETAAKLLAEAGFTRISRPEPAP